MGIAVQFVTSTVRQIPAAWKQIKGLFIVVSIDGLQPEHDVRRAPAVRRHSRLLAMRLHRLGGLQAVADYRLLGLIPLRPIFTASSQIGRMNNRLFRNAD
jgi:hypothetical protein